MAVSDDQGTLWLITKERGRPAPGDVLTRIDPDGQVTGSYRPALPLKPLEWVDSLAPAVSGHSAGLLASLASGGKDQTFEGAFFLPPRTGRPWYARSYFRSRASVSNHDRSRQRAVPRGRRSRAVDAHRVGFERDDIVASLLFAGSRSSRRLSWKRGGDTRRLPGKKASATSIAEFVPVM